MGSNLSKYLIFFQETSPKVENILAERGSLDTKFCAQDLRNKL